MKRLVTLLMTFSLAAVLCACSNPLKAASDAANSAIENTTSTTVVLEDPSVLPVFIFYDADDNTQIALSLDAVYVDWHYLDEDKTEQTILSDDTLSSASGDASAIASGDASVSASGDASVSASGDASDASGDASGNAEAIVAAAYLSLQKLDVDDDSEIYYSVDPGATPDRMEQTSWKTDYIGSESADAMEIYTKLANFYSLPMKADRVYQITVTYAEENFESRGYYGTLTYMLITE